MQARGGTLRPLSPLVEKGKQTLPGRARGAWFLVLTSFGFLRPGFPALGCKWRVFEIEPHLIARIVLGLFNVENCRICVFRGDFGNLGAADVEPAEPLDTRKSTQIRQRRIHCRKPVQGRADKWLYTRNPGIADIQIIEIRLGVPARQRRHLRSRRIQLFKLGAERERHDVFDKRSAYVQLLEMLQCREPAGFSALPLTARTRKARYRRGPVVVRLTGIGDVPILPISNDQGPS